MWLNRPFEYAEGAAMDTRSPHYPPWIPTNLSTFDRKLLTQPPSHLHSDPLHHNCTSFPNSPCSRPSPTPSCPSPCSLSRLRRPSSLPLDPYNSLGQR